MWIQDTGKSKLNGKSENETVFTPYHRLYRSIRIPFRPKMPLACSVVLHTSFLLQWDWSSPSSTFTTFSSSPKLPLKHLEHIRHVRVHISCQTSESRSRSRNGSLTTLSITLGAHPLWSPGRSNTHYRRCKPLKKRALQRDGAPILLGLCNTLRLSTPCFAFIADPLNKKLQKSQLQRFEDHTDEEKTAMHTLQEPLISPPILSLPRTKGQNIVCTNSGIKQVGAVLLQQQPEVPPKLVRYWSRSLRQARRSYNLTDHECLEVILALLLARFYLEGSRFTFRTCHSTPQRNWT